MVKTKQADYWLNLSFLKEVAFGLKEKFKEELPFLIIRIQTLEGENIDKLIEQFPEELFKDIGSAYNYDNLYFFVLPEYLKKLFSELDKINSEIIECIGQGFFEKTTEKDLCLDVCMFYEKKKARKGTVKVNIPELKWLSEPIFRLDEAREMIFTKRNNKKAVVGLAYYGSEEWPLFKKYSRDCLEETYEEWNETYENFKGELEKEGKRVIEISVKVEEMQKYFEEKNLENNSHNRARYVSEKLVGMEKEGKLGNENN